MYIFSATFLIGAFIALLASVHSANSTNNDDQFERDLAQALQTSRVSEDTGVQDQLQLEEALAASKRMAAVERTV